jgi:hypothetical protein
VFSSTRKFHPLRAAASAGLKGALPKVLLGAALLGGGGSVLFAGSAQAGTCTFGIGVSSTCTIGYMDIVGDKKLTITGLDVDSDPGELEFTQSGGFWFVDLDWTGNLVGPKKGSLAYDLEIIAPPVGNLYTVFDTAFINVGLPLDGGVQDDSVFTKEIVILETDPVLTVLGNGTAGPISIFPASKISVKDTWDVAAGDQLDNMINRYNQTTIDKVPGPLPLLGAGMAFGFSRKLRSRIKARVQA